MMVVMAAGMVAAVAPTWWPIPMHFAAVIGTTVPTVPSLLIRAGSLCRHLTGHSGPGCVSKNDALNGPARNEHPRSRRPTVYGPTHYWTGRSRTGLSGDCRDIRIRHLHCLPVLAADLVIVFLKRLFQKGGGVVKVCHQCGGKFGLVRYHYLRNSFCSRQCLQCFKQRQAAEVLRRKLYGWFRHSS